MAGQSPSDRAEQVFEKWCCDNGGNVYHKEGQEYGSIREGLVEVDLLKCDFGTQSIEMKMNSRSPYQFVIEDEPGMISGTHEFNRSKIYVPGHPEDDLRNMSDNEPLWEERWEDYQDEDWEGLELTISDKYGEEDVTISPA